MRNTCSRLDNNQHKASTCTRRAICWH